MAIETELKLSIPATEIERFTLHPLLNQLASTHSKSQHLIGTYYDTPGLELKKAKFGLRIRREGERWIQTVKTAGSGVGGLHQRHEWEVEVADNQLEFASLPKILQEGILADNTLRERIAPAFTSDFQRITWELHTDNQSIVEVCLDQGKVYQGDKSTPICEVELELKRGEPNTLFQLALELQKDFSLVLENASKAQRGYELSHPCTIAVYMPSSPTLTDDMAASEVFPHLIEHYLTHLQANEAAALDEQSRVEGLAQLYYAVRCLQSCFAMCRKWLPVHSTAPLLAELDWLEQQLHEVHGWDTFSDILETIELQIGQQTTLRELAVTVAKMRLQALETLKVLLQTPRYTGFILQLNLWLLDKAWRKDVSQETQEKWQTLLPDFARKRLAKQHKRLKAWPKSLAQLSSEEQRGLRQDCIYMEAVLEFFNQFYGQDKSLDNKRQNYMDWLAQLREELDNQHEAFIARYLFEQAKLDTEHPACYFLQGWYAAKQRLKTDTLEQTWKMFSKQKAFWKQKT